MRARPASTLPIEMARKLDGVRDHEAADRAHQERAVMAEDAEAARSMKASGASRSTASTVPGTAQPMLATRAHARPGLKPRSRAATRAAHATTSPHTSVTTVAEDATRSVFPSLALQLIRHATDRRCSRLYVSARR